MPISEQQVARWKAMRQRLADDVEPFAAGKMHIGENNGSGWKDTTAEFMSRTRRIIETYDEMIAEAEKAVDDRS